jgi:hypothetical protein
MRNSLRGLLAGGLILADTGGLSAVAGETQELGPLGGERRARHEQPDHGGKGSASDQADQRRPGDFTGASGAATS